MPLLATFCTFHVGGLWITAVTRAYLKTVLWLGLGDNWNFITLTDVDIGAFWGQIRFTDPVISIMLVSEFSLPVLSERISLAFVLALDCTFLPRTGLDAGEFPAERLQVPDFSFDSDSLSAGSDVLPDFEFLLFLIKVC